MASPITLHIGRPCHVRCTRRALDGPFPAPSALGRCQGHGLLGTPSALGSTPRPRPSACSGGAGPHGPCGLARRSPQHHPYNSSSMHVPLGEREWKGEKGVEGGKGVEGRKEVEGG